MIEAMACGTPVIAFNRGSVPEVIDHGLTGFIVTGRGDGGRRDRPAGRAGPRQRCALQFDRRFTARRMAEDYVDLYEELCEPDAPLLRAVAG